ncbi:MAG: amidohydrolase family protein [Chloroflexi bacterium]|nr:amidohydrolase family protein [Chloroflexota bacterium]
MAMILDNHVHVVTGKGPGNQNLPPRYRWTLAMTWAYGGPPPWTRNPEEFYPRQEQRVADPDGRATIAGLDRAGVDGAVMIPVDFGPSHGLAQEQSIEETHETFRDLQNAYPGRLFAFAGPDARRPDSLELVRRAIGDWGFKGLKLMPEYGYYTSDRLLYGFYDYCLEADVPVAICTNFEPPFSRGRFNDPLHLTDVVADFPDLNVIFFHAGYPLHHWWQVCLGIARTALNTYLELDSWILGFIGSPARRLGEEETIRRVAQARDTVGAHRVLFGSDIQFAPTSWGEEQAQRYVERVEFWKSIPERAKKYGITFSQEEMDLMMGLNLARLLKIVDMPEYRKKRKYGWKIVVPPPRPTP